MEGRYGRLKQNGDVIGHWDGFLEKERVGNDNKKYDESKTGS